MTLLSLVQFFLDVVDEPGLQLAATFCTYHPRKRDSTYHKMKAPSTLLLRAMLRPQQPLCQIRSKSDWMPREKYAKITLLDKLHRRQKEAIRRERM